MTKITSRKIDIKDVIISKQMLNNLCTLIHTKKNEISTDEAVADFNLTVSSANNISTSVEDLSVFNDGDILDTTQTEDITIRLDNWRTRTGIDLTIHNSDRPGTIQIKSSNTGWVNSTHFECQSIVDSWDKQKFGYFRDKFFVEFFFYILAFIISSTLLLYTYTYLGYIQGHEADGALTYSVAEGMKEFIVLSAILPMAISGPISSLLSQPVKVAIQCVHLDFGPENTNRVRKAKTIIKFAMVTLAIPVIIGLLV